MPIISDSSSDLSDVDQLSYESDSKPTGKNKSKKASRESSEDEVHPTKKVDELDSEMENEDYIDELESTPQKSNNASKKESSKSKMPTPKGKLISFDSVNIPKGDKASIDKFIATRVNDSNAEEVLVKYKVIIIHQNMSFFNAEWILVSELEKDKNCRIRLRRFLEKSVFDLQWSEDEPFNPAYIKVFSINAGW